MLCLRVRVPSNYGIDLVAAELAALAQLTQCVLETDIDRVTLDVYPGNSAETITEKYRRMRADVDRWAAEELERKTGKKPHVP